MCKKPVNPFPAAPRRGFTAMALVFAICSGCREEPAATAPAEISEPLIGSAGTDSEAGDTTDSATLAALEVMLETSRATLPYPIRAADGTAVAPPDADVQRIIFPNYDPKLDERRQAQLATRDRFRVPHEFRFADRFPESGITFRHQIVDDSGRTHTAAHYDHGNGVTVADVDGDGLLDVYFTSQLGGNELWRNIGDGRFENITELAGVAAAGPVGVTATFADIDNDGDADLYVTRLRAPNLLFENDGTGRFTDISASSGLDYNGHSSAALMFDYNRDGLLDVLLSEVGVYTTDEQRRGGFYAAQQAAFAGHLMPDRSRASILFRNLGGNRFENVNDAVGFHDLSWTGDTTWLDVNDDCWPDLYVLDMQGHDDYWENVDGTKFIRRSRDVFPATPWGTMGVKVFDFNNDDRLDLFLTDMHTDMVEMVPAEREKQKMPKNYPMSLLATDGNHVLGNAVFRNDGDSRFTEISDAIGAENYWPWGLSVGDLNADGWQDVFITASMNYPYGYGVNSLLLNNQGEEFLDSEFIVGVEPRRGGRTVVPWFTIDCDSADKDHRLARDRSGILEVWGSIGSRSSVMLDLDGDGDLDIITNDFGSEPQILISDLAEQRDCRFLKITLVGTTSNRDGLGAGVTVTAHGRRFVQQHDGKSGYLSQSRMPLYFGLGDATEADSVQVVWPSGIQQTISGPHASGELLTITEAKD